MVINDPAIVREVAAAFAGYDRALQANDVAALNRYFWNSPLAIRYGNAENLYGIDEIGAYRASVAGPVAQTRERTVITTYGADFATVSTLSRRADPGRIGRTMQSWVRFPEGWRIVAAHVSTIGAVTIDRPLEP